MSLIKLVLTDVDGCLTDGKVIYTEDGKKIKKFDMHDGMGVKILHENNIKVGIISSDDSYATKIRAQDLKMDYIYIGEKDKLKVLNEIIKIGGYSKNEIAYMGDDIQDIPVIENVGFSVAPSNADYLVKNKVNLITKSEGGNGAFRELANYIIEMEDEI